MVAGTLSTRAFLAGLPQDMLDNIIDACARIAVSRRQPLLALKASLRECAKDTSAV
jgi:hypothetical protein